VSSSRDFVGFYPSFFGEDDPGDGKVYSVTVKTCGSCVVGQIPGLDAFRLNHFVTGVSGSLYAPDSSRELASLWPEDGRSVDEAIDMAPGVGPLQVAAAYCATRCQVPVVRTSSSGKVTTVRKNQI
jgi:hypothetical protein